LRLIYQDIALAVVLAQEGDDDWLAEFLTFLDEGFISPLCFFDELIYFIKDDDDTICRI
jgi:hypothetical protein